MKHGLSNLAILIFFLLLISSAVANFLETWLLDTQKKRLREKFESWWLMVSDYDRLKFCLACTQAFNNFANLFFGEKLFSKKAFYRSSVIATGLLFGSLAFTGLFNHQLLGIAPWGNYKASCEAANNYADFIVNHGLTKSGSIEKPNVTFSSINTGSSDLDQDDMPAIISALTMHSSDTNIETLRGNFTVAFWFSKHIGTNANDVSQAQMWSNNVVTIREGVQKYDTTTDAVIYSFGFYLILFIANTILGFGSLVLCRAVLREICATGRVISMISLMISNFFCLSIASSIFLLLILILSVPLFWILLPFASDVARASFVVFIISALALSFSVWAINCIPLNLIAVIAFLPFFFSLFATFFSLVAIIFRNWIHFVVSAVLLRCADKNPFAVIGSCLVLTIGIVTAIAKLIHGIF